jgi:uncharacterized membrane protein YfcA
MFFLILSLTGAFVGILSAFFGVGGGVLIVPVLYTLFPDSPPSLIIGTSLTVIFFNSIVNTINFRRLGRKVPTDWGSLLAIGMMAGVIISTYVVQHIDRETVRLIFALVLVATGVRTLFFKAKAGEDNQIKTLSTIGFIYAFLTGFGGGMVAGLTGLGGGIVMVPILLTIHKLPLAYIPAFSNFAMIGGTFVGMIRYGLISSPTAISEGVFANLQVGSVHMGIAAVIFLSSTLTSKLGAKLSGTVSKTTSKRLFVVLLIVMSGKILFSIYGK